MELDVQLNARATSHQRAGLRWQASKPKGVTMVAEWQQSEWTISEFDSLTNGWLGDGLWLDEEENELEEISGRPVT